MYPQLPAVSQEKGDLLQPGSVIVDLAFILAFLEVRKQTQDICGQFNPLATYQIRELVTNLSDKLMNSSQLTDLLPFPFYSKTQFLIMFFLSLLCSCLLVWLASYCHLSLHFGGASCIKLVCREQCRIPHSHF